MNFAGEKCKIRWITLDIQEMNETMEYHKKNDPKQTQYRSFFLSKLGTEIIFHKNGEVVETKGQFSDLVNKEWAKFVVDVYDCIKVFGLVPIEFTRRNKFSDLYPTVPEFGTYIIQMAYIADISKTIYRVIRKSNVFLSHKDQFVDGRMTFLREGMEKIINERNIEFENRDATFMWNNLSSFISCCMGNFQTNQYAMDNVRGLDNFYLEDIPSGYVLERNIIVFDNFKERPTVRGKLTTSLASLNDSRQYLASFAELLIKSEILSFAEPSYIEHDSKEKKNKKSTIQSRIYSEFQF